MLAAGLYTKFPQPDYVLGVHDSATLPAGVVSRGERWRCEVRTSDGAGSLTG